jgi:hypothetical protein
MNITWSPVLVQEVLPEDDEELPEVEAAPFFELSADAAEPPDGAEDADGEVVAAFNEPGETAEVLPPSDWAAFLYESER